ncbi:DCC1-like thiol-disulfide oxidoreductase family protein [Vicingaceae bacterium]|nr:DCC1-like thiol-disulfide oxidoreductase family protein [Vicingaceae bacterium]
MDLQKHIILFDGECNFCNFWVKYVIKRDKKNVFLFSSLQSEKGLELLRNYKVSSSVDSVVLIEPESLYIKSTAALRILKTLGGFLSVLYGLIIIPTFLRDFIYDLIASVRYKFFGKSVCELPTKSDYKERFL